VAADGLVLLASVAVARRPEHDRGWFGVETYPPAILFAIGLLFILVVLLHYSTVISAPVPTRTPSWRSDSPSSSSKQAAGGAAPSLRTRV
jgi:hypothetical protein